MARPWRIQFPDAVYHVIARGNKRADIFLDDADRKTFLQLVEQAGARYGLRLFAFCLMPNHYHLFLCTPRPNLSQAMHWLNVTYTVRFNRRHRTDGHLLQGRYKAILITDEGHWQYLSIYLHLNPVRAGLVADPADYFWSSFHDYTQPKPRFPWLECRQILMSYGGSVAQQRRYYRQACRWPAEEQETLWAQFRGQKPSGSPESWARLAEKYRPRGNPKTVPQYRLAKPRGELATAMARVAEGLGLSVAELQQGRGRRAGRQIAFWYLVARQGQAVSEVGRAFGVGVSAVSMAVKRIEQQMKADPALARRLRAICEM